MPSGMYSHCYTQFTMKTALISILLFALTVMSASALTTITGSVMDSTGTPLAGASVILRNAEGKIKKYASTGADGTFSISAESADNCTIDVSMIGFGKKSVSVSDISTPIDIRLEPEAFRLKEVAIKAERIREQGDTITYNVGSFAQTQDRSIGDVLKRMPGIDVAKSGKIQYQGTDINKFYIEGSDLLGGRYGIATNGISHEDVGAVEVMENHQPMQVLSGISFSDKAAINLKLKKKAKATWTLHGNAGGGYSWQPEEGLWESETFAMAVMPSFQNITTVKTNNTGDDLTAHVSDFFGGRRQTGLRHNVDITLPGVPSLDAKRTLFNRSFLASANSLWKLKNGEFKTQIDYAFNRISARAANVTTYFLSNGNRVITEQRDGTDRTHSLSAKFVYEKNLKTTFLNNTLQTDIDWDNIRLGVTGSLPNTQTASLPDYYVRNTFKLIRRLRDRHLITFESRNEWESLPQTLNTVTDGISMRQHIGDHAFFTDENAAYALSVKGITISLTGGLKGYVRSMHSGLSGNSMTYGSFENAVNTNYFTIYATPKLEYWIRRVNIKLTAPVSFARYTFDQSIADRSEVYFSPELSINWKPSNRLAVNLQGGTGRSPMNLNLIHPEPIMTDYRSFNRGVDRFYNSSSQNLSAGFQYKHTRHGLFANALVMQSWNHMPYTLVQQLYGDYVVYSYSPARSSDRRLMVNGNIGKTLDFIRGSANLRSTFSRNESTLISEESVISSIGTSWSAGIRINGTPLSWLSLDIASDFYGNRLSMNSDNASWLGSIQNSLLINIMPHRKWEYHISGEHYRNEIVTGRFKNTILLDTRLIFKLNKRIELSGRINNIFNRHTYNYTTYNQLGSFESQRRLRGRELLITISLRK